MSGTTNLSYTGGTRLAGKSCEITVSDTVSNGTALGAYSSTTNALSVSNDGGTTTFDFPAASDDLTVTGIIFTKEFLPDTVIAGETSTLRFTIDNEHPTEDATITIFTDNLEAELAGLSAAGGVSSDTWGVF